MKLLLAALLLVALAFGCWFATLPVPTDGSYERRLAERPAQWTLGSDSTLQYQGHPFYNDGQQIDKLPDGSWLFPGDGHTVFRLTVSGGEITKCVMIEQGSGDGE